MITCLARLIAATARRHRDRPAVINLERNRTFTHGQMDRLTNRLCRVLSGRFGLDEGDAYATLLDNEHIALFHPWMFKSPVTAAWIDVRESTPEILAQLDLVRPRLIFLEARFVDRLRADLAEREIEVVVMDRSNQTAHGVHLFWDLIEAASDDPIEDEFVFDDASRHTALLRFTGGTTGRAKCAAYSPSNLWTWGMNPAHYLETVPYDHPRAMLFSPINHAASGSVVIPIFLRGGTLITLNRADPETIGRQVAANGVELIYCVPTVLYRLLAAGVDARHDMSSLKTIRYGGAPIAPAKLERLLEAFGPVFVQGYGSTEAWPSATILGRGDHLIKTEADLARLASIGRPFPGQEVLICDDEGRQLPTGETGELWIRGANTISGYYGDPDQTAANFSPNGFWKSGDLGYIDDEEYVFLVDRKKDLIISGGFNVYATEVENCLCAHPAVADSAVIGLPDEDWGEAVSAAVMLRPGETASAEDLISHCKERLARYKAPKRIDIVTELPLSPAGKVLRRRVREIMQGDKDKE